VESRSREVEAPTLGRGLRGSGAPRRPPGQAYRLYHRLAATGFSETVLASGAANLCVLPVSGVRWSDWGRPQRVLSTLQSVGASPAWAERARARLA
jgi:hypothetical protein